MTLYPATKFLSREHYDIIVRYAKGAKTALEFGPGATTLALVEAGVKRIDTFDHDPKWIEHYRTAFRAWGHIAVGMYVNAPVVTAPCLDQYDIAIVDSPQGDRNRVPLKGMRECSRLNTMMFALARAPMVFLHDANRAGEVATLRRLGNEGYRIEIIPSERGLAIVRWA